MSWKDVCQPKKESGLGILNLEVWNQSIWFKWVHMYLLKHGSLWGARGAGDLSWQWRKLLKMRPMLQNIISVNIGDGNGTNIWFDNWHPYGPLHQNFSPNLLSCLRLKSSDEATQLIPQGV